MNRTSSFVLILSLLFAIDLFAQRAPVDSVKLKQSEQLEGLDGLFVLKLGTIYRDTEKEQADRLLDLPQTIVVSNGDRTLDVLFEEGKFLKAELIPFAEKFAADGFDDMQIVRFTLENNEIKLVVEESEDDLYTVTIGIFDETVPVSARMKILSVAGLRSIYDKSTNRYVYVHGVYYNQLKAKEVTLALANAGLYPDVLRYGKGVLSGIKPSDLYPQSELISYEATKADPAVIRTEEVIFRVQVGTFAETVKPEVFGDVEILVFPHNSKLNKCYAGAFTDYKSAYKLKLEMKKKGFNDAFIVAYKNGVALSINELVTKEEYEAIQSELGR